MQASRKSKGRILVPVIMIALAGWAVPTSADTENGALPAGTSIGVEIVSPADGAIFVLPSGATTMDVPVTGAASVQTGVLVQDITIAFVLDVSGSMDSDAGVDCTGDGTSDTRLLCLKRAVGAVVDAAVGPPVSQVDETGVAIFASGGTALDVDYGAAGDQLVVAPDHDGDGNGVPDVKQAVNGLSSSGLTCYSCGISGANDVLSADSNARNLIVFISDGHANMGAHVTTTSVAPGTTVKAFAIGAGVSCATDDGHGSLNDVAALSTLGAGSCEEITDFATIANVVLAAIGSKLNAVSFDAGSGFALLPAAVLDIALPSPGPTTAGFAFDVPSLGAGTHTLCARAHGTDAGGSSSVTDCHTITIARPPDCDGAAPSLALLWPPNHQLVTVGILGVTHPEGTAFTIAVDTIFQDEPTSAPGSGAFAPDGFGIGQPTADLRAERLGTPKAPGDGRVYEVGFTATDTNGGTCSATVAVGVPHDLRPGGGAVNSGATYDSTL